MPRGPRLEAPNTTHHLMVRGLERRALFRDDKDRRAFLDRLAVVVQQTGLNVFAWALLSNHVHLLVRTPASRTDIPYRPVLATAMRRLLTGYAVGFNRRHKRAGHVCQNRYKSILVEEDAYLLELVRYLHLNPIRAGVVKDLAALDRYPWTGHSALMGKIERRWQAMDEILGHFGSTPRTARSPYRQFVSDGIPQGRRPELQGGGLRRSAGGWAGVSSLRRGREMWTSDERILGSGEFVERILREATEIPKTLTVQWSRERALAMLPALIVSCAEAFGVTPQALRGGIRQRTVAHARSAVSALAVTHLSLPAAIVARELGVTPPIVLRGVVQGPSRLAEKGVKPERLLMMVAEKVQ